jgi:hypothetical protein
MKQQLQNAAFQTAVAAAKTGKVIGLFARGLKDDLVSKVTHKYVTYKSRYDKPVNLREMGHK